MSGLNQQLTLLLESFQRYVTQTPDYSTTEAERPLIEAAKLSDEQGPTRGTVFFFEEVANTYDNTGKHTPLRDEALEMATVYKSELTA